MISPELLRRYPFLGTLEDAHLNEFAMISDQFFFEAGKIFFKRANAPIISTSSSPGA